jgi:hypothetical protein
MDEDAGDKSDAERKMTGKYYYEAKKRRKTK